MLISFSYEERRGGDNLGWGAYPAGSVTLPLEQTTHLNGFFSGALRLGDLPKGVPWIGSLRMPSGLWVVAWHSPGERRVPGLLLTPDEWDEIVGDFESIVTRADTKFAENYLRASKSFEDSWRAPLTPLLLHPVGETCVEYLPLALTFIKQAWKNGQPRNHGCATAWRKGLSRPDGLNVCPFAVREDGPGTLEKLVESLRFAGALVPPTKLEVGRQEAEGRTLLQEGFGSATDIASAEALKGQLNDLDNRLQSAETSLKSLEEDITKIGPDKARGMLWPTGALKKIPGMLWLIATVVITLCVMLSVWLSSIFGARHYVMIMELNKANGIINTNTVRIQRILDQLDEHGQLNRKLTELESSLGTQSERVSEGDVSQSMVRLTNSLQTLKSNLDRQIDRTSTSGDIGKSMASYARLVDSLSLSLTTNQTGLRSWASSMALQFAEIAARDSKMLEAENRHEILKGVFLCSNYDPTNRVLQTRVLDTRGIDNNLKIEAISPAGCSLGNKTHNVEHVTVLPLLAQMFEVSPFRFRIKDIGLTFDVEIIGLSFKNPELGLRVIALKSYDSSARHSR